MPTSPDTALASLICERNDHPDAPACDGCYAMAAHLRENGYVRAALAAPDRTVIAEMLAAMHRQLGHIVVNWRDCGECPCSVIAALAATPPLDVEELLVRIEAQASRRDVDRLARAMARQDTRTPHSSMEWHRARAKGLAAEYAALGGSPDAD